MKQSDAIQTLNFNEGVETRVLQFQYASICPQPFECKKNIYGVVIEAKVVETRVPWLSPIPWFCFAFCNLRCYKPIYANTVPSQMLKVLRHGFHDCLRYQDGSGGCDGCLNRCNVTNKTWDIYQMNTNSKWQTNLDWLMLVSLSRKGIGAKFEGNTNDFQYPDIIEGDSNGLVSNFLRS